MSFYVIPRLSAKIIQKIGFNSVNLIKICDPIKIEDIHHLFLSFVSQENINMGKMRTSNVFYSDLKKKHQDIYDATDTLRDCTDFHECLGSSIKCIHL